MRTGGRLLVDSLVHNGVDFMTCVPGESFLPVLDAIYEIGAEGSLAPRLITTRHEAAAANMVEAAGKLTGRVAACFVTRGPGAMHASIAVHTAYQDGTPMLLVIGQVAREVRGREGFQELDYQGVFGGTAKSVVEIQDAARVAEHVARAVYLATAGRPGPVVLVVPEDMLAEETDAEPVDVPVAPAVTAPREQVDGLLAEIAAAHRPLLIVGGPKWSAGVGADIRAFAEANDIPIAAAFRWQDAVDNRSDNYAGYLGLGGSVDLRSRALEADLVVAFGARLDDPTTNGFALTTGRGGSARFVVVSDDAREAVRTLIPDAVVTASLDPLARELSTRTIVPSGERTSWTKRLREEFLAYCAIPAIDDAVDLARVMTHIREQLPDDTIVTNGAGNYTVWLQRFFQFRRFGTQLAPRNGAMGYGLPAAIAAAALRPGTPVVAFAGDGCILMSGSELATAVREKLNLVLVIVNNSMFGTIRMHQEQHFPGHVIATPLSNPDFALYAQSFGATGSVVTSTEEFPAAFAAAVAHDGPSVIEVRTDPLRLTPDRRLPAESILENR